MVFIVVTMDFVIIFLHLHRDAFLYCYVRLYFILEIEIRHLQLRDGMTYYVSVTACNVAGLCTTATSDGILIDSSPPVPGRVIDGTGNKDIRYQASR